MWQKYKLSINYQGLVTDVQVMMFYKNRCLKIATLFMFPVFVGCTSASLTVNSVPEKAKVLIRPVGGGEAVSMGETPLVLSRKQLKSSGAESGPIFVEVQKPNFRTEKVLITESDAVDMRVSFALQLEDGSQGLSGPGATLGDAQELNQAIDQLFEVRKYIDLESYNEALIQIRNIEQKWPFLSAAYEMKGGVFFLQKKYKDALVAFSIATKYNPNSVSSANMVAQLEQQLGISGARLASEYEKSMKKEAGSKKSDGKTKSTDSNGQKKRKPKVNEKAE